MSGKTGDLTQGIYAPSAIIHARIRRMAQAVRRCLDSIVALLARSFDIQLLCPGRPLPHMQTGDYRGHVLYSYLLIDHC